MVTPVSVIPYLLYGHVKWEKVRPFMSSLVTVPPEEIYCVCEYVTRSPGKECIIINL